jgi:hypothetical protein
MIDIEGLRGTPGKIRTCDLLIRSQTLYPAELRAHALASGTTQADLFNA